MRLRVFRDSRIDAEVPYRWIPSNNIGIYDSVYPYIRSSAHVQMLDVVTPGFFKVRNQGLIINNPKYKEEVYTALDPTYWIMEGHQTDAVHIHCEYQDNGILRVSAAEPVLPDIVAFSELMSVHQREIDLAVTRAWANVDVSEMQILASIGELPETLAWFKSLLTRGVAATKVLRKKVEVNNITRSLAYAVQKRGKISDARELKKWLEVLETRKGRKVPSDAIGIVSNAYLEYRYAIRPLLFDLQNCLDAMSAAIKKHSRQTVRGKEVTLVDGSAVSYADRGSFSASHYVDMAITTTEKGSVVARAGVLFEIEESLSVLKAVLGFDQPLESAWELVRWSFIADWFFSIGDVISSWSQSSGLTPLTSWVTVVHDTFIEKRCTSCIISDRSDYTWDGPRFVHLGKSYGSIRRTWRVPSPVRTIIPRFDLRLNLGKILDLGAIGRGLLHGQVPKYLGR